MISVVIPTYNHRDYISATLDSVFEQTCADYEVIVVNDGSPDNTGEVLRPLVEAGKIAYIEQANRGQGAARNRGLQQAQGEFVVFLDDDDLLPPDKLAWQSAVLRARAEAVLVYGTHLWLEPDGELLPADKKDYPSGQVANRFLEGCWLLSPGQAMIRRSALVKVGGFDEAIWGSDDWDLYIRLAQQGEFVFEDKPALHYRRHAGNASRNALKHVRNHYKVMRKHFALDVELIASHLAVAGLYFTPNLRTVAEDARARGDYPAWLRARLYMLTFDPLLLARANRIAKFARRVPGNSSRSKSERRS